MESVSFWTLDVTVVRAWTRNRQDFFSKSDLYVTLSLPTATAVSKRTRTISNSQRPEWNQIFSFRVPTRAKNVLELQVFDEDFFTADDLVSTVMLDLGTMEEGPKVTRTLTLDPKGDDVLELELELTRRAEEPVLCASSGIVLAPPLSAMDVSVERVKPSHFLDSGRPVMLRLKGAFEEHLELKPKEKLRFYINRDLEMALELTEKKEKQPSPSSVTLKPHPPRHSEKVSLRLNQSSVDLLLEAQEVPREKLSVRLDLDVPPQEKEFLMNRRRIVAVALQTLLGLDSPPSDQQMPVIAVVASGGGARACTATLGALKGLKEIGLLDAITYITAVSGATWAVSRVFQDEDWSQNLDRIISETREQMTKETQSALTVDKLRYYHQELEHRERRGHLVSGVDMAGLIVEHVVFGKKNHSTLSDQQRALRDGQNPLPIYTAVHSIKAVDGHGPEAEWVEFTPYEVGLQKYGAYVRTEDFGSEFFLGHLVKKLPELRLPFLLGIWSSIFSYTVETIVKKLTGAELQWTEDETEVHSIEEDNGSALDTLVLVPDSGLSSIFNGLFQNRPVLNRTPNFIRGLFLHQDYNLNPHFQTKTDLHPDVLPNRLTPSQNRLRLIDSGLSIKISCPPVLRPQRHAHILIVLSNGWDPDRPSEVLEKTAEFCEQHGVPFPKADFSVLSQAPLREIYVFRDPQTPGAPTVLHLPLVNASFRDFKAPGVRRVTPEEVSRGQLDVSSENSPFVTTNLTYSASDFDDLIDLTTFNVLNNRDTILSSVRRSMGLEA